jgi:hypothetical protein
VNAVSAAADLHFDITHQIGAPDLRTRLLEHAHDRRVGMPERVPYAHAHECGLGIPALETGDGQAVHAAVVRYLEHLDIAE